MRIPLFILRYTPGQFVIHAVLTFALVIYGLPLLWLFIASTRTESSMYSDPPLMLGSWHALKQFSRARWLAARLQGTAVLQ